MSKIELSKVREYNRAIRLNKNGIPDSSIAKEHDVRETVEESIGEFAKQVFETRQGLVKDRKGNKIPAHDVTLEEAVESFYGADMKTFYKEVGIFTQKDTLATVADRFGMGNLNKSELERVLIDHTNFASPTNTKNIPSDYRFIIAEVMTQAIRTGYQNASMHENWIAMTQTMTNQKLTIPRIERGDAMPRKVNEGAAIPVGSLKFNKKEVEVFKVATGLDITDELITASTIDMMFEFLQEVGNDMSIGADVEALRVLVSGEQADGSESAPVVGVTDTAKGFQYRDLKRVFSRMSRLKRPATRLITDEDEAIDITGIDRFEGYQGSDRLATIRSIIGVPDSFDNDIHVLPDGQILFLAPDKAMAKLKHKGLLVERLRNPQTQTESLFVSDFLGFAIIRRDARVLLDKTVTYVAYPFPAYMDIDSRITEAFKI